MVNIFVSCTPKNHTSIVMAYAISAADVNAAHARIAPHVHRTPVLSCASLDAMASSATALPISLHFKCELFQRTGSFKARGATNAVLSLPPGAPGVCTHSSGNHAAALAYAAGVAGLPAHIVMPSNAPRTKVEAVKGYGGRITECAPTQAAREAAAADVASSTGAAFIHPSENPHVIAGQGTLALELLEQAAASDSISAPLDVLIVPVGGGGMISGCAVAAKARHAGILVIGAEPAGAADAFRSKAAGQLCGHDSPPSTIADGLRTTLGPNTWPIVRDLVDSIVTVSEGEITDALKLVYSRLKLAIEPSAAVGVAVALSPRFGEAVRHHVSVSSDNGGSASVVSDAPATAQQLLRRPLRVGVVLCGGNVDLAELPFR